MTAKARKHDVNVEAFGHFEATLERVYTPRCPGCWERDGVITPNPNMLSHCPRCGDPSPGSRRLETVHAAVTGDFGGVPLVARFFFWLADKLRALAARMGE